MFVDDLDVYNLLIFENKYGFLIKKKNTRWVNKYKK